MDQRPGQVDPRPSEGTPVALTRKNMYQPGGAIVAVAGNCSPSASAPVTWRGRSTRRCSASSECVVAPGRIRHADAIWLASGTVAAKKPPYVTSVAAGVHEGRSPANR